MNSAKSDAMFESCGANHAKKTFIFGIAIIIVGLLMQGNSPEQVLVVIGFILVAKSLLEIVLKKDK